MPKNISLRSVRNKGDDNQQSSNITTTNDQLVLEVSVLPLRSTEICKTINYEPLFYYQR
jgi:hypothetical protein